MRLLPALFTRGAENCKPIPFQEILPLKLKPEVSGKGDKTTDVCCIYEMSVMFACLKRNDFTELKCPKEIGAFQKCYEDHTKNKAIKKERDRKGILTPGEKRLSYKQINKLLKMYPNIK